MPFTFTECPIKGLIEIQPKVFGDHRGYFLESWSKRDFAQVGIDVEFVQDNQSMSCAGVLRGLHFQKNHPQGKLVRVIEGEVFDVAVDIRDGSSTWGCWHGVLLSAEKQNQFWIPEGFAHGFLVLSPRAVFAYKCTDFYYPEHEAGLLWNDPGIGIKWPEITAAIQLSDKDTKWPVIDILKKGCSVS